MTLRLTPDLFRGLAIDLAEEAARVAVRYADRGVVGLGLGGAENQPAEPYRKAFAIARDGGLGIVPHAGEADGPELDPRDPHHGPGPPAARHPGRRGPRPAGRDRRAGSGARRVPDLQPPDPGGRLAWPTTRCRGCVQPAPAARSTPTTRRCSGPTWPTEYAARRAARRECGRRLRRRRGRSPVRSRHPGPPRGGRPDRLRRREPTRHLPRSRAKAPSRSLTATDPRQ